MQCPGAILCTFHFVFKFSTRTSISSTGVVTWVNPPDITADTTLSNALHLNARALGGAKLKYTRTDGNTIVEGNKLPAGTTQTLKVVAEATPRYEEGEATVTIKVAARPVRKK